MAAEEGTAGGPKATPRPKVRRPVGPKLRVLVNVIIGAFALLSVNAAYLLAVDDADQNWFYLMMFLIHLAVGLAIVVPVIVFGVVHWRNARHHRNRRAIRVGYALFAVALILLASGFVLTRVDIGGFRLDVDHPVVRPVAYWAHVITPVLAIWLFTLHRLVGRRIKWKVGVAWGAVAAAVAAAGTFLHDIDSRRLPWGPPAQSPASGDVWFQPSLARTATGDFIPAHVLDNDDYCLECHSDIHDSWSHSVHAMSSFNNPAYAFSVRETRQLLHERDGSTEASRFCAGCHDPVPFFSGAFDDPKWQDPDYEVWKDPLGAASITCTSCHAIQSVESPRGNAHYIIDEPEHYPFTFSESDFLKWVNRQLVKAKPAFHKETFLKPVHQTTEFCGSCHKVHLPEELNDYKWLRGQNHHDSFRLSGVSGANVASFYYPPKAQTNCNQCHMPRRPVSEDGENFAADVGADGTVTFLDHMFPSANTALPYLMKHLLADADFAIEAHREFTENSVRVDLFGLREGGSIDGELVAPLGPETPELEPGEEYLVEVVLRTLTLGHLFTEGTADSNQVWVDFEVLEAGEEIARSGGMDDRRRVDPWAHFVNAFVLDRTGRRIDRRNAESIFVPLYNHQIPPGAADSLHYRLRVPENARGPITVRATLRYRKFDTTYLEAFHRDPLIVNGEVVNDLPIIDIGSDVVTLPVRGAPDAGATVAASADDIPAWQRWNDYGIGLLRRGQLRQAREVFERVEALGRPEGPINQTRVFLAEGLVQAEAPDALARAAAMTEPRALEWHLLWFGGQVAARNGDHVSAVEAYEEILRGGFEQAAGRDFDFNRDDRLRVALGESRYQLALLKTGDDRRSAMEAAREPFLSVLRDDPEQLASHWGLRLIARDLGDEEAAAFHSAEHAKYKPDDNSRDAAVIEARRRYPAADAASEDVVIYDPFARRAGPDVAARTAAPTEISGS